MPCLFTWVSRLQGSGVSRGLRLGPDLGAFSPRPDTFGIPVVNQKIFYVSITVLSLLC